MSLRRHHGARQEFAVGSLNPDDWDPIGAYTPEETPDQIQRRKDRNYYIFESHSWGGGVPDVGVGGPLADLECEHLRLPGDPCPSPIWPHASPCGCWPSEQPPTNGRVNGVARNGSRPQTLGRTPDETKEGCESGR
jgi:hypothetical protein